MAAMRQRSTIMTEEGHETINLTGGDPESINMAIIVELMLDIRQITAAQFVIANGGTLPTPSWLENIAEGK